MIIKNKVVDKVNIRHKLKAARNSLNLTQENMEQLTGIERSRYTKIENGNIQRISLADASAIARALNTTIEELFAEETQSDLPRTGTC